MHLLILALLVAGNPASTVAADLAKQVKKHDLAIAELRADLVGANAKIASLEARLASQSKAGSVEVVSAREVHAFNPVKAAANVATAPLRAVGRTVCGPGGCVEEATSKDYLQVQTPAASTNWSQGECSNGQCMPTQRRGFFGRRRGW